MLRYAALAVILSIFSQGIFCIAAGNIGCLFSETLCNQEKEWCYDDYAFGRCLPLYGNVREEDMHKYELGTGELHVLEREMQRLFLLGYRWSHTYTQCVLQSLLKAIRSKAEFDVSGCNAELDQDLEGALKAIEGEEVEHIDPKNLAIVRFMPSVINPHSDYADELYYPPVEEMLPPYRGKITDTEEGDEEGDAKEKQVQEEGDSEIHEQPKNKSTSSPTITEEASRPNSKDDEPKVQPQKLIMEGSTSKEIHDEEKMNNRIENHYNLPPPAIPMALFMDQQSDDPSVNMEGDYDYDIGYDLPYNFPPPNPVYKRGGYPVREVIPREGYLLGKVPKEDSYLIEEGPIKGSYPQLRDGSRETGDSGVANLFRKNPWKIGDLRELSRMLGSLNYPPIEKSLPQNDPNLFLGGKMPPLGRGFDFNNQRFGSVRDQGIFRETPVAPSFRERMYPSSNNEKIKVVSAYEKNPANRGMGPVSQIPLLNPPAEEEANSPPDTIHSGFVKGFEHSPPDSTHTGLVKGSESYQRDEAIRNKFNNNKEKYYDNQHSYDNSVARFEKDPSSNFNYEGYRSPSLNGDANRYKWMDDIKKENDQNNYRTPKNPQPKYDQSYGPPLNPMSHQQLTKDAYYGRAPYPPYSFNNYEYADYPDYYDYGGEYLDLGAPSPWNLQRDERLDVKKPGPFFKSANDFGFDYPEGGDIDGSEFPQEGVEGELVSKMDPLLQGEALLLSKLRQGKQDTQGKNNKLNPDQVPDLLLTEEGYVESLSGDSRQRVKSGSPKADLQVADKDESKQHAIQPDSYVYISIGGRFHNPREAEQLVHIILRLVGLDMKHIQNLSVENNQVMFQVRDNDHGMTAAHLAERTEELRAAIKEKTGMEITQAGVGTKETEQDATKSAMSAVVYSSGERQMLAAAAIVCGICAALLVAATVLYFLRRQARSKAKMQGLTAHDSEASKDYQDLCRARMAGKGDGKEPVPAQAHSAGPTPSGGHAPGQRISSLSKESDNGNNSPSSRSSTSSWSEEPVVLNMDISTGHMVLSYMEDHLRNKDRLDQEWVALCAYEAEPCACNIALKPENAQKNRYSDVLPYDHNRVILNEHTNVSGSNYINASSITDHDPRNPAYISTQGPLTSTAADFWQLVWEQGSVVIVMLTRLTENGQALCHRYWPEEGSELYHIYEVHLVSEHIWCDDYLVRSFYLKNVRTSETRTVTQFHFLSWPESGIPASTKALLEFRRKVNKSYRGRSCPIIVHCSDGVGRAGTYCLIDMVLNRMAKGAKEIDIAATLEHIRDQRPNMVKTKIQFEFVLMAVAEEVHAILKALSQ